MKSSFHSLIPFLQFLCSQAHMPCRLASRNLTRLHLIAVIYYSIVKSKSKSKSHCNWRSVNQYVLLFFGSYGLVFVGRPLWREDGSVFCICCLPSPGSLSRVRVPWDSWPYFTVSDLGLPFSLPPTIRRVTVEVFDPASTRRLLCPFITPQHGPHRKQPLLLTRRVYRAVA
jgi:hypothetical protein